MKQLKSLKFTEIGVPEHFDVRILKNANRRSNFNFKNLSIYLQLSEKCIKRIHENLKYCEISLQIMDDHGRWRLELEEEEAAVNMYESEPCLEDHNKDKVYCFEKCSNY